jgi:hypothetical protein
VGIALEDRKTNIRQTLNKTNEMSVQSDKLGIDTFVRYRIFGVWKWETNLLRDNYLEREPVTVAARSKA